ncbi:hypothetical protein GQ457_08G023720 [Hibiscus cannabinus]
MDAGDCSDDAQVPVINITGMTRDGSIHLTQLVYNVPQIKDFFFILHAWIYVLEDFDVIKMTKTILHVVNLKICDTD